ncbi:MAG: hypothetical protein M3R08_09000 [Bacteroidota bacterium]|nr:hypothetical protein [Bacteroidota bacterium]
MACGAEAGEPWETDPMRSTQLGLSSRLHDVPLHVQRTEDIVILCDECNEGLSELRKKWAQGN